MSASENHYQNLLLIFLRYLCDDIELLKSIEGYGGSFNLSNKGWQFTVPDLYGFLSLQNKNAEFPEYERFRKMLYDNPLHFNIKKYQGKFEIVENHGHVDKNVYRLFCDD